MILSFLLFLLILSYVLAVYRACHRSWVGWHVSESDTPFFLLSLFVTERTVFSLANIVISNNLLELRNPRERRRRRKNDEIFISTNKLRMDQEDLCFNQWFHKGNGKRWRGMIGDQSS
jgi:hypothetical protein